MSTDAMNEVLAVVGLFKEFLDADLLRACRKFEVFQRLWAAFDDMSDIKLATSIITSCM